MPFSRPNSEGEKIFFLSTPPIGLCRGLTVKGKIIYFSTPQNGLSRGYIVGGKFLLRTPTKGFFRGLTVKGSYDFGAEMHYPSGRR